MLYIGQIPRWDLAKIRPAGSPLKTFGGRASGPEPLESLFNFAVNIFKNAAGNFITKVNIIIDGEVDFSANSDSVSNIEDLRTLIDESLKPVDE